MPRSMWKGAIQFGLVTIPVKLYVATESKGVNFHMLHARDSSRIQQKIYCPADDAIIERSDTVRGYEIAPDQYVVVTDEDLASVPLKTVRAIEIEQFVPASGDGETRFVKNAYYLEPDPIARKAFLLLREVLQERGLRAVAKIVLRDREQLAVIEPFGGTMALFTLHWPDEIRPVAEVNVPSEGVEIRPAEKAMAEQLVAAMTGEFDAGAHHDEYREALLRIIEAKAQGATIEAPVPEPAATVGDLMAALQASVVAAKSARAGGEPQPIGDGKKARKAVAVGPGREAEGRPEGQAEEEPETVPARRRKSA